MHGLEKKYFGVSLVTILIVSGVVVVMFGLAGFWFWRRRKLKRNESLLDLSTPKHIELAKIQVPHHKPMKGVHSHGVRVPNQNQIRKPAGRARNLPYYPPPSNNPIQGYPRPSISKYSHPPSNIPSRQNIPKRPRQRHQEHDIPMARLYDPSASIAEKALWFSIQNHEG